MLFMGIDVGSSGCKASVINEKGETVSFASEEYSFVYQNGTCELDPHAVLEKVSDIICELGRKNDLSDLKTISVTSFGEMFVLLDENKQILRNSISYEDTRGVEELNSLGNDIYEITGATPDSMYALPKLMWIKNNEPIIYKKTRHLCMFADFILFMLGAEHHTDYSLAARTLMFDVKNKCWSSSILSHAGIDQSILGKLVLPGTPVGTIDTKFARSAKLPEDVMLLAGAHDQVCAALGAGIIKNGMALDGMGSNECIVPTFSSALINQEMKRANLVCVPYAVPNLYVTYAFNRTAGALFKWYKNLLGSTDYESILSEMPDKPTDLFVLPHFAGAATPYMDNSSVGAVAGLKLSTTRGELTRAIIEGLNYEMLINVNCLKNAGFQVEHLFVSGGLAKSDRILQIKADIMNVPVQRLANSETGTVGVAILGSVAVGLYKSFEEATGALVSAEKIFYPDQKRHEAYMTRFEKYEKMYMAVKEIMGG